MRSGKTFMPLSKICLAMLLSSLCILPGCWNLREPQNQAIILALGIDYDEIGGLYEVYAEIAIPTALAGAETGNGGGGGGGGPVSQVLHARGHTVFEALRNLEPLSPRELYWGHNELVVFSESMARQGVATVLDFFERERQSRLISRILVTQDDLKKLLETDLPLEDTSGLGFISQIMTQELNSATVPAVDLRGMVIMLSQPGIDTFAPRIRLAGKQDPGESGSGGESNEENEGSAGENGGGEPARVVEIKGGAVFKNDRLVGWLEADATRGWLWITGNVNRATEIIFCPECAEAISVEVIHYNHKIEAVIKEGQPKIIVHLDADSRIQDTNCMHPFVPEREELIPVLNRRTAEAIRHRMELAIAEAKALQVDIFGFGREFFRRHPHLWHQMEADWPYMLQRLEVDLRVEVDLRRVGLIIDPIQVR